MRRAGAFFDVDGTLTRSDIVRDHVAFRRAVRNGSSHALWMAALPARIVGVLLLDRWSRTATNRVTYSWYRGLSRADFERWADAFQADAGVRRLHARGLELLRRHAQVGHRLVFITGSIDLLILPLARHLERELGGVPIRVEAVRLREADGTFTGDMLEAPLGEGEKARRLRAVADEEDLDLLPSYAYGDSIADLPLLEAVGRPAAVNPDARLRRVARRRGWPVLDFWRS
jgi:HAD superfamily hydrolase (TIGR01490 family)